MCRKPGAGRYGHPETDPGYVDCLMAGACAWTSRPGCLGEYAKNSTRYETVYDLGGFEQGLLERISAQMTHRQISHAQESARVLVVDDLSAIFPDNNGGLHALASVTFSVHPQEFICVLGPSGSGKSTLLRILAGLLPPSAGTVAFAGSPNPKPAKIGFVFQQANLIPWRTVLQNITLPLELENAPAETARRKAQELVELVGLDGFEES